MKIQCQRYLLLKPWVVHILMFSFFYMSRWNLWYRFQEFYELHVTLSEVAASLSGKFPVILPPFPSRAIKYVQDHFDPEFSKSTFLFTISNMIS